MKKIISLSLLLASMCMGLLFSQDPFDQDSLQTLEVDFYNPFYDGNLKTHWLLEDGYREPAQLKFGGRIYDSVAVRYKGNSTFVVARDQGNPKLPLNIDMNDIVSGQNLEGYKKIKLANALFDPTMAREVFAYNVYRKYMPASLANHLRVYIQGQYTGVYVNTESVDKTFLKKHFAYNDGVLFKCDPAAQYGSVDPSYPPDLRYYGMDSAQYVLRYDLKTDTGWRELIHLIDILNNDSDSIHTVLNVDRVLWNFAVSTVICNLDVYNGIFIHNYYLYQHENGLFQMIPWDLSESFGGALLSFNTVNQNTINNWSPLYGFSPFQNDRPLVNKLLQNPVYHKQYLAHIRTVMEESFDLPTVKSQVDHIQSVIAPDALADPNTTLGSGYFYSNVTQSVITFFLNISGIMVTANGRKPYLDRHPEIRKIPPSISQVLRTPLNPKENDPVFVTASIGNATGGNLVVDLMVTTSPYASHFQAIPMVDDGMHGDGQANDGVFGGEIPFVKDGDPVKYYIRAQNNDAMRLDPARAEYEFHEYTVEGMPLAVAPATVDLFTLYPNPTTGIFYLEMKNTMIQKGVEASVTDITGHEIRKVEIQQPQTRIDLSSQSAGIYFLNIPGFSPLKILISSP
ncbi:CotH kinase family protein [bacterium]|nr:CotH kinase family protein [bacterium]